MANPLEIPTPEQIRRTAVEVLSSPDFQIERDTNVGHTLVDLMLKILKWVLAPFRWLFEVMDGLPDPLRWLIVIGLFLLALALLFHIIYSLTTTLRPIKRSSAFLSPRGSNPRLNAEEYEQLAQQSFTERDYIAAVRFLFRAGLTHLQDLEGRKLSPGLTNRQYLRRYKHTPFVDSLQAFVDVIDASWYGSKVCRQEDYSLCRDAYAEIRRQTKADFHAHHA